jgi:hypothetical protein
MKKDQHLPVISGQRGPPQDFPLSEVLSIHSFALDNGLLSISPLKDVEFNCPWAFPQTIQYSCMRVRVSNEIFIKTDRQIYYPFFIFFRSFSSWLTDRYQKVQNNLMGVLSYYPLMIALSLSVSWRYFTKLCWWIVSLVLCLSTCHPSIWVLYLDCVTNIHISNIHLPVRHSTWERCSSFSRTWGLKSYRKV